MKDTRKFFEQLNKSYAGRNLVEYLNELLARVCDIRQYPEMDDATRKAVAKVLQEEIINRILLVNEPKELESFE